MLDRLSPFRDKAIARGIPADEWGGGGEVSDAVEGWVLLADWDSHVEGREGATVHWAGRRTARHTRRRAPTAPGPPAAPSVQAGAVPISWQTIR